MPWRNRINPFGDFEAVAERGLLIGNRGCLINKQRQLVKPWELQRWICCVLEFKGRHREVMTPGRWTELFFLDEATAFAAGHRPCFECRRRDAQRFFSLWNQANHKTFTRFPQLDAALHEERLQPMHTLTLANGVFVAAGNQAYLYWDGQYYPWTPGGYLPAAHVSTQLRQLTPSSIARTLSAGYEVLMHPTHKYKRL